MTLFELIPEEEQRKIRALHNPCLEAIITEYVNLCQPAAVKVVTDDSQDIAAIRQLALVNGEEQVLKLQGHTVHFDGYNDQGRDKENTRVLISQGQILSRHINSLDREAGLAEIRELMAGIMRGKTLFVRFYCLGPRRSDFSILALQLTDSAYVAHSEDLLYRPGYEEFKRLGEKAQFFHFIHAAGELDEHNNVKNIDKRRIYIDIEGQRVFSINNQYAGNSVGLKKLALRLAIHQANQSDWLAEHMFIMGVNPPGKARTTYFAGAFPSACGKTSTAMIPGQTIVGDDIAYLRVWQDDSAHAVNIESGIFGIITDVNPIDDPLIYECLTTPRELIFSNILIHKGQPYWQGMGIEPPKEGINFSGKWYQGKVDAQGKPIPCAHKNARYTMRLSELSNVDPNLDNPNGVQIDAIIYGGRDSDTNVPILQALNWAHGVFYGATLESETTAATLGQEGKRVFSPMANLDFIVVPLRIYFQNHLRFGERLRRPPLVFQTNYFLRGTDGNFLCDKIDKKVWILWAEGRVHGEYTAIPTPIGYLPHYSDLARIFRIALSKEYREEDYIQQFSIRIPQLLAKLERAEQFYRHEQLPEPLLNQFRRQRQELEALHQKYQSDLVNPFDLI